MTFPFDIQNYKELVDNAELGPGGYYPIGTGNIWHSGVHINYKGGGRIIRPIIPGGRVVAFRLSNEYQECELPENISQDAYLHEFAQYQDTYMLIKGGDYAYYELDKALKDKTYSVSNNFILLKHEIESEYLSKKLVFYCLYMNLAPVTDKAAETRTVHTNQKPFYPDFMLDASTKAVKAGFTIIEYEKSQGLSGIGKPGFLKGSWYFDFCVFFESSLFDFKEKILGEKKLLFHHFDESIILYTRGKKREVTSRKFYWPNGTEAEKVSYTDEGKTVFQYKITKIRPIVEISSAKAQEDYKIEGEKITILKTDNLWLSGRQVAALKDFKLQEIEHKTFDVFYIDGNGGSRKPAFYVSSEYFEDISFWTTEENLSSAAEYEVYDKNPLVYDYEVFTPEESFYKSIIDIDTQEFEINNLDSPVVKVQTESDKALYIKVCDKDKCYKSAFNWSEWFYNLNGLETHKDDIICDRTSVIEKLIEYFNEQIRSLHISQGILEKWWYGAKILDEYLKGIFGSNEKYEFAQKMRGQFQKAVCRHPLEWDATLFNCEKIEDSYFDITHMHLREHVKTKLIKEREKSDIWEGALQNLFKKNDFYFVNPLYFAHHLDRAEVFGFNPYEKHTFSYGWKYLKQDGATMVSREQEVLSNPGFAPFVGNRKGNINGYAPPNGLFREAYPSSKSKSGKYAHEGVDFECSYGDPIHSLIYGTVIKIQQDQEDKHYGLSLVILSNDGKLYLLGHLSKRCVANGIQVYPGMKVAEVGNSGKCFTGNPPHILTAAERKDGKGKHLHLSVYNTEDYDNIWNGDNQDDPNFKTNGFLCNPFNHTQNYYKD